MQSCTTLSACPDCRATFSSNVHQEDFIPSHYCGGILDHNDVQVALVHLFMHSSLKPTPQHVGRMSSALWLGHCNILIHFFQPFCCKCIAMMGIIVLLNDPFSGNRSAQLTLVYRRIHGWLSDCKVPNDQRSSTVLTVALRYLCSYTVPGFLQTRAVHHGQTSLLGLCSRCFVVCLLLPSCSFQREEATCSVFF